MSEKTAEINVLLVDDSIDILYIMKHFLEDRYGFKVTTASSGFEALKMLREGDYDAMVSDLHMPEMGGKLLYAQMIKEEISVPLIFFSGSEEMRDDLLKDILYVEKTNDTISNVDTIAAWIKSKV